MPELKRNLEELRRPRSQSDAGLNNELLAATAPPKSDDGPPKRNSKDALIDKIITVSAKYELPVEHSDTKLRRMNKKQLAQVLAAIIEEGVKIDMCKQVGVAPGSDSKVLGLAALRMMHDIAASTAEKGLQHVLPQYGYDIDGFSSSLKEPVCSQAIDQCLTEIAAESPELLQYFESPYARLALAWSGALLTCIKRKDVDNKKHAAALGPRESEQRRAVRSWNRRRPQNRQEHCDSPPSVPTVLEV